MQRISVPLLQPGMVTARRIYSDNGRLIMNAATTLTDTTITKLRNMGIGSVYIQNPLFAELEIPELVQEDTRIKMILALHSVISRFQRTQILEIQPLKILISIAKTKLKKVKKEKWQYNAKIVQFYSNIL